MGVSKDKMEYDDVVILRMSKEEKKLLGEAAFKLKVPLSKFIRLSCLDFVKSKNFDRLKGKLREYAAVLFIKEENDLLKIAFNKDKDRKAIVYEFEKAVIRHQKSRDKKGLDKVVISAMSHGDDLTRKEVEGVVKQYLPHRFVYFKKKIRDEKRKIEYSKRKDKADSDKIQKERVKKIEERKKDAVKAIDCEMIPVFDDKGNVIKRISRREKEGEGR